jgi:hypothetical protein
MNVRSKVRECLCSCCFWLILVQARVQRVAFGGPGGGGRVS